jgi:hypothetical protein
MFMQVLPSPLHPYKIAFDPFQYRKVSLRDQKQIPPRCSGLRDIRNSLPFSGIERNLSIFYLARDDIKAGGFDSFPSERASLCESGFAASWLAQDGRAACADDDCLSVGEDSCDCEAARAFDIHEE